MEGPSADVTRECVGEHFRSWKGWGAKAQQHRESLERSGGLAFCVGVLHFLDVLHFCFLVGPGHIVSDVVKEAEATHCLC